MAKILHIETSAAYCSVSIAVDGIGVSEATATAVNDHIGHLTLLIEKVCASSAIPLKQMDAVAVSSGPGSYTGLRIGVSTAKGICQALNIPLISVNSLESMFYGIKAHFTDKNVLFCPLIDARRMEVYTLIADTSGSILVPQQAYIVNEGQLLQDMLTENHIVFFGTGLNKCKELLNHEHAIFYDDFIQTSTSMHFLANRQFLNGNFENIAYFEPLYIKEFYTTQKIKKA